MDPGERTWSQRSAVSARVSRRALTGRLGCVSVTMEPMDWTAEGTGVAGRPGWVLPGAGLTVGLALDAGAEEERGLFSDRSTGSVWSGSGDVLSVLKSGCSSLTSGLQTSPPAPPCGRKGEALNGGLKEEPAVPL